jgi:hypothetical protein
MLVIGASEHDIQQALNGANKRFAGNLEFKRFDKAGITRDRREKFNVTLTVKSSREPGARRGFRGQRLACACWHAHGYFLDGLPKGTEVRTTLGVVKAGITRWHDSNIGSMMHPLKFSEACDCAH